MLVTVFAALTGVLIVAAAAVALAITMKFGRVFPAQAGFSVIERSILRPI